MKTTAKLITLFLLGQAAVLVAQNAGTIRGDNAQQQYDEHPFHEHPPAGPMPATLDPANYKDDHSTFVAYTLAGRMRELLYQEPCFCPCHKEQQHQSLLDCFAGHHGVSCQLCKQEVIYCYEQGKLGKNPAKIRRGLMNYEWGTIDAAKYADEFLSGAH
jgi:hypothetical protein